MATKNPVRSVLSEELQNSERLLKRYQQAIAALPKGSLVPKKIKGGVFYYLAYRKADKVRFDYKGKLSAEAVAGYKQAASQKAKYRGLIADIKKQIVFLKRALHERKRRSRLIVSPVTDPARAKEVKAAFKRVVERHGKTLAKLAK